MIRTPLRLLLVEDSDDDAMLVSAVLERQGYDIESRQVMTADAFRAALEDGRFDIILCDYSMPAFDAFEALTLLRESGKDIPLIIVSGTIGETEAVRAMRHGAADYLLKDNLVRLGVAVERELREAGIRRHKRLFDTFSESQTEVLEMILNAVPLRQILERIATFVAHLSGFRSRCAILLTVPNSDQLVLGAVYGFEEGFFDKLGPFPIGKGLSPCGAAVAMGENVVFEDIFQYSDWHPYRDACREAGLRSCWSVPVFSADHTILASIGIYHQEPYTPVPDEIRWTESASKLTSLAIERSRAAERLKSSEALLRIASEATHIGGWIVEFPENRITWSDQVCAIHEVPPGTAPSFEQALNYCAPEWRESISLLFEKCMVEGTPFDRELELITARGRRIWVRAIGEAIRGEGGVVTSIQGAFEDITEKKESEQELARSHRALRMLSSCNEILVRASDEKALLEEVCRIAVEIGGYGAAWVGYTLQDEPKRIVPMAYAGDVLGMSSGMKLVEGVEIPCFEAIFTGQTVVVSEFSDDCDCSCFAAQARQCGYASTMSLPLLAEGRVLGALCLYGLDAHAVGADDIQVLREMANDLSFGIANMRSREVRRRTEAVIIKVAQTVSGGAGSEFFDLLAGNMVEALGARVGLIGKLNSATQSIDTISYILDGTRMDNISYDLHGTPCEDVAAGAICVLERGVRGLFPDNHVLARLGIEAYVGIPLLDQQGVVAGVMAVFFTVPLHETALVTSTLRIFAARAASELNRQKADARIREQASLLDKARDAILVRDLDHRITYWNKSAERLYGWTAEEAIGSSVVDLLYQEKSGYLAAHEHTLAAGEWVGELNQIDKTGRELIIEGRWNLVTDDAGQPQSVFAINTDISEFRRLELQFIRAQRLESIGILAGGIAHDLNNILTPISMAVELLKMREPEARCLELLDTIAFSANRGSNMVGRVLSFARGIEGCHIRFHPRRVITEIESILRDTLPRNIELEVKADRDLWGIEGDPTQIHQVILNLCVNAGDAISGAGRISICAENVHLDASYAAVHLEAREGPYVCIWVNDTGEGIPAEIIDKIFDPFFTTKAIGKGTGLGLPTSMAIVKSHGGFLRINSKAGVGTLACVYIPAHPELDSAPRVLSPVDLPKGGGETILVVDDEAAIRQIACHALEDFGYRTLSAANGAEALSLYLEHQSEIAVVFTDLMMPVMDGQRMIGQILEINPAARILASSGIFPNLDSSPSTMDRIRHFLPKPYAAETLLKCIRHILENDEASV